MDRNDKQTLAAIAGIFVACLATIYLIRLDVPPLKKQRLILDTLGCKAARQLALKTTAVDSEICEVEDKFWVGLAWVTFDQGKINRARVVAVEDPD